MPRVGKTQQFPNVHGSQQKHPDPDPDPEPAPPVIILGKDEQRGESPDPDPEPAPPVIILGKDEQRGESPDPDPEPAPPIIILRQETKLNASELETKPAPQSMTSFTDTSAKHRSTRYNLRDLSKKANQSDPDPDPEPEPEPAPPIIILGKRQASSSPGISDTDMGNLTSKVKEQSHNGKLQSSVAKEDKEQMKEPKNYYTHRSKSMRRKAGANGGSGEGSGGGLQGGAQGSGGGLQ